jgi:hypothetical protein
LNFATLSDFKIPVSQQVQHWLQVRIQGPPTQVTGGPANSIKKSIKTLGLKIIDGGVSEFTAVERVAYLPRTTPVNAH